MAGIVDRGLGASAVARCAAEGGHFLRFCCVGAVGFGVDALILAALVHLCGAGPIPARLLSAVTAMLTTFELNRRWAFRGAGAEGYGAALAAYLGVQSLGFACNIAVYAGCCLVLPAALRASPAALMPCLALGSATALALNYAGASRVVFRATAP